MAIKNAPHNISSVNASKAGVASSRNGDKKAPHNISSVNASKAGVAIVAEMVIKKA